MTTLERITTTARVLRQRGRLARAAADDPGNTGVERLRADARAREYAEAADIVEGVAFGDAAKLNRGVRHG